MSTAIATASMRLHLAHAKYVNNAIVNMQIKTFRHGNHSHQTGFNTIVSIQVLADVGSRVICGRYSHAHASTSRFDRHMIEYQHQLRVDYQTKLYQKASKHELTQNVVLRNLGKAALSSCSMVDFM